MTTTEKLLLHLRPPPRLTVDRWADKFRYLPRESSARPGKYRSDFAPYQREPQREINNPEASTLVLMWASQVGKTELLNNAVGYFIHSDPASIMIVQPTVEMAEAWSKERLAPTIRDTPVLRPLVRDPKTRDSGNTVAMKSFPGGNIAIVGANAPGGLAGRPRRVVLLDEVDRYPPSAGSEGDPCALAIRRTESFHDAVVILTSTPTIKGMSRIESEFDQTDQRRWFCPCPKCGTFQVLKWSQVQWPKGEPEKARYVCEKCRAELDDKERIQMVKAGEWRPTAPFRGKRGYHLNGIASPFPAKRGFKGRLHQMAAQFLEAKRGGSMQLRVWINTFLAETYEEEGDTIEAQGLLARREDYDAQIPIGVVLLTAGVDVQGDRLEAEIVGWGLGEESWGIEYIRIPGSPHLPATWAALDQWLMKSRVLANGVTLHVSCCLIDSGDETKIVYDYTRTRATRNVFAAKGIGGIGKPLVGRFSRSNSGRVILFPIGTDTAKELLMSRLKLEEKGAGYMHFPKTYDEEWFAQLTAEKKVTKWAKGRRTIVWEKIRPRNEALDCRVYATAALAARNFDLKRIAALVAKQEPPVSTGADSAPAPQPAPEPPTTASNPSIGIRRPSWSRRW